MNELSTEGKDLLGLTFRHQVTVRERPFRCTFQRSRFNNLGWGFANEYTLPFLNRRFPIWIGEKAHICANVKKNGIIFKKAQQNLKILFFIAATIIYWCRVGEVSESDTITNVRTEMSTNKIQIDPYSL